MADLSCPGCGDRDARIAELTARVAALEPYRREATYRRDEARAGRGREDQELVLANRAAAARLTGPFAG